MNHKTTFGEPFKEGGNHQRYIKKFGPKWEFLVGTSRYGAHSIFEATSGNVKVIGICLVRQLGIINGRKRAKVKSGWKYL